MQCAVVKHSPAPAVALDDSIPCGARGCGIHTEYAAAGLRTVVHHRLTDQDDRKDVNPDSHSMQVCLAGAHRRLNLRFIDIEIGVNVLHIVVLLESLD